MPMRCIGKVTIFGQMTPRAGLLSGSYGLVVLVLLLCAFGASIAQGATCLVDDAGGNDANSCCTPMMGACKTIHAAIMKAAAGDTVSVAAGMYTEAGALPLLVNKTLTLLGAQAGVDARTRMGPESVVADPDGTSVSASNVVIDGFTFQDSTNAAFTGFGIDLNPGVSGTQIVNNIFQNNIAGIGISNAGPSQLLIRHNLFQNDNDTGGASGDGIYTDQFVGGTTVTNVLVEENTFKGNNDSGIDLSNTDSSMGSGVFNIEVRNNSFDMNGRAFDIFNTHMMMFHDNSVTNSTLGGSAALRIFDFNSDITIVNNNLAGGVGDGIHLSNLAILGPSSNVRINFNNITPFALDGLLVDAMSHVGTVDATCNWWGSATGPTNPGNPGGTGEAVVGDANFDPWFIGPAPGGPCGTPTATATGTPTATPTAVPQGGSCINPTQCATGFCVTGVCCNSACTAPEDSCAVPGRQGECVPNVPAPVPALSERGLLLALASFVGVAALALARARRRV